MEEKCNSKMLQITVYSLPPYYSPPSLPLPSLSLSSWWNYDTFCCQLVLEKAKPEGKLVSWDFKGWVGGGGGGVGGVRFCVHGNRQSGGVTCWGQTTRRRSEGECLKDRAYQQWHGEQDTYLDWVGVRTHSEDRIKAAIPPLASSIEKKKLTCCVFCEGSLVPLQHN